MVAVLQRPVRGLRRRTTWVFLSASLIGFAAAAAAAEQAPLDTLVRAYPDYLAGYDATDLIWRDGTRMPLSDRRPTGDLAEMLRRGSILDQINLPYPAGAMAALEPSGDPGR